jgi:bisphosphoglycerate-dependent phosphoglycerate mutase
MIPRIIVRISLSPNVAVSFGRFCRYQKYLVDLRYSMRETIIRSIEKGRLTLHRKLPKAESLKDCMDRTIPFFTERIVPEAINQGKRVLISSSENAIRGLLMYLCEIPEDKITELEIPNGLPYVHQSCCPA